MTFNFVSMVRRDVEVDCAIAGLWVRAEVSAHAPRDHRFCTARQPLEQHPRPPLRPPLLPSFPSAALRPPANAPQDMEAQVRREAHTEMVSQLMARLGELEDSLELVHSGAVKAAELYSQREQLKVSDRSYIKAKLARLKKHAEDVVEVRQEDACQETRTAENTTFPATNVANPRDQGTPSRRLQSPLVHTATATPPTH